MSKNAEALSVLAAEIDRLNAEAGRIQAAIRSAEDERDRLLIDDCRDEWIERCHAFEHGGKWWSVAAVDGRWVTLHRLDRVRFVTVDWSGKSVPRASDTSTETLDRNTGWRKGTRAASYPPPRPVVPPEVLDEQIALYLARLEAR